MSAWVRVVLAGRQGEAARSSLSSAEQREALARQVWQRKVIAHLVRTARGELVEPETAPEAPVEGALAQPEVTAEPAQAELESAPEESLPILAAPTEAGEAAIAESSEQAGPSAADADKE